MVLDGENSGTMEACLRGFSFMPELPEKKSEVKLEYIESGELERTWRTARRQRLKEREQRIWDDFVKEQDVLSSVCNDDPYQFLEQLPEACLKELMEIELQKMKKEAAAEKVEVELACAPDAEEKGDGDSPRRAEDPPQPAVPFADADADDPDLIRIFDDEKDDDQSGPEDEVLNESTGSPCTVRDRFPQETDLSPVSPPVSPDKGSTKSSENVTNMIESSIYCAKVRDLRAKISDELLAIVSTLECRDILGIDPEELVKMCRRSAEFCSRFNRIYMYQLHRQIHDVKRNSSAALPLARHTQFQSQMVRIVSLHQNLLQSLQVYHKSLEQTGGVRESGALARALARAARAASAAAAAARPPPRLRHASHLYSDSMSASCDRLDEAISEYAEKMTSYMNSTPNTSTSRSKKSKSSRGKKSMGTWSKSGSKIKSIAESRLSMYSLDTLRINLKPKSSSSRDNQSSGTSKLQASACAARRAPAPQPQPQPRKSPRSRRPLMRDPQDGRARRRAPRDHEIRTMVEAVEACTSSHISREPSPPRSGRPSADNTPRRRARRPQRALAASARPRLRPLSPAKGRKQSPKPESVLFAALSSMRSVDPLATAESSQVLLRPASRRDTPRTETGTPRTLHVDSPRPSPRPLEEIERLEREKTDREKAERERADLERIEREQTKLAKTVGPGSRCEVGRIVRQLCGGDAAGNRNERISGAKNAQLVCVHGSSPRQPSTPQLLRILEETIQKKVPKTLFQKPPPAKSAERYRLTFNIPERTAETLFQYRTKFVQHMLASPMYANSSVGKPWEMISSVSDQIIEQLLVQCAQEMQLSDVVQGLYRAETR